MGWSPWAWHSKVRLAPLRTLAWADFTSNSGGSKKLEKIIQVKYWSISSTNIIINIIMKQNKVLWNMLVNYLRKLFKLHNKVKIRNEIFKQSNCFSLFLYIHKQYILQIFEIVQIEFLTHNISITYKLFNCHLWKSLRTFWLWSKTKFWWGALLTCYRAHIQLLPLNFDPNHPFKIFFFLYFCQS